MDPDRPRLPLDDPLDGFLSVSEAIHWMASIGGHLSSKEVAERWNDAARKFLQALALGLLVAEGHGRGGAYVPIPKEDWRGDWAGHLIELEYLISVDPTSGSDNGFVLISAAHTWKGVHVRKAEVRHVSWVDLRDSLIKFCSEGRLTPEEAQAWAQDVKFPLEIEPDPAAFDPMKEPDWSLGMALAWIITGSIDAVREMWEEWRKSKEIWVESSPIIGQAPGCWFLRSKAEMSYVFDLLDLARDQSKTRTVKPWNNVWKDARVELWRALRGGRLVATGLPLEGGSRQVIPAFRWRDLDLDLIERKGWLEVHDYVIARSGFGNVAMSSSKVRSIWPQFSEAQTARVDRETQCREWLTAMMRDSPDSPSKPKSEFLAEARNKFSGIPEAAFNRAWSAAIKSAGAKAWSRPGRRPKSPRKNP